MRCGVRSCAAGSAAHVDAGVSLCPAYDVRTAFASLGETSARVEELMLGQLKDLFVRPNEPLLRAFDGKAVEQCLEASSLDEFIRAHAPFALGVRGAGADEYFSSFNPMEHFRGTAVPPSLLERGGSSGHLRVRWLRLSGSVAWP